MLTKREITLIIILMVLLAGVLYYLLFFQPTYSQIQTLTASVAEKELEIDEARLRTAQYALLSAARDNLEGVWAEYRAELPEGFDDAEILRRIQKIVFPYTKDVSVSFPGKAAAGDGGSASTVTTVSVSFQAAYSSLVSILNGFHEEEMYNRIINYTVSSGEGSAGTQIFSVSMQVDFLTQ